MLGIKKLKEENKRVQTELEKALLENTQYKTDLKQKDIEIKELKDKNNLYLEAAKLEESCKFEAEEEMGKLAKKYKKISGAIGGYKKENNKLRQELNDLKEENRSLNNHLKDLMSDRYLRVKLPAQKPRVIQKTRLKNRVVNSSAKEILKSKTESEEEHV